MLLASLGDSVSCGEGVGLRVPLARTWVGLLAGAMPVREHLVLAVAGSRTRDLRERQLGPACAAGPSLATVVTGLNDVSRSGFDAERTADDLRAVVDGLLSTGAHVLLGRLHDPTHLLPLPPGLARCVRERVAVVNAAVDSCVGARVLLLDLAEVPLLRSRAGWAVDRLHPSLGGHAAIAHRAADVLRLGGWQVEPLAVEEPAAPPHVVQEAVWLVRHGLPYLAGHSLQVGAPLLAMAARGTGLRTA